VLAGKKGVAVLPGEEGVKRYLPGNEGVKMLLKAEGCSGATGKM
jgi:hypothetical protein